MNTRLSSMSSRSTRRSVMYLPTQMGRLPRYFLTTFSSPSITSSAGLMPRMFGPEGQHTGAAAALGHKVQPVQYKAQLYPFGKALQPHRNVAGRQAVCSPLGRFRTDSPARYRYSRCPPHRRCRIPVPARQAFWKQDESLVLTEMWMTASYSLANGSKKFDVLHQDLRRRISGILPPAFTWANTSAGWMVTPSR